eukprot:scaffold31493_cov101-Isochrysis_galbana.AAC.1
MRFWSSLSLVSVRFRCSARHIATAPSSPMPAREASSERSPVLRMSAAASATAPESPRGLRGRRSACSRLYARSAVPTEAAPRSVMPHAVRLSDVSRDRVIPRHSAAIPASPMPGFSDTSRERSTPSPDASARPSAPAPASPSPTPAILSTSSIAAVRGGAVGAGPGEVLSAVAAAAARPAGADDWGRAASRRAGRGLSRGEDIGRPADRARCGDMFIRKSEVSSSSALATAASSRASADSRAAVCPPPDKPVPTNGVRWSAESVAVRWGFVSWGSLGWGFWDSPVVASVGSANAAVESGLSAPASAAAPSSPRGLWDRSSARSPLAVGSASNKGARVSTGSWLCDTSSAVTDASRTRAARADMVAATSADSPRPRWDSPSSRSAGQCRARARSSAASFGSRFSPRSPNCVLTLSSPVGAPPTSRAVRRTSAATESACTSAGTKDPRRPHAPSRMLVSWPDTISGSNATPTASPRPGLSLRSSSSISVPASDLISTTPVRGPSWSDLNRRACESPGRCDACLATEFKKCLLPSAEGASPLSRQRAAYNSRAMAVRVSGVTCLSLLGIVATSQSNRRPGAEPCLSAVNKLEMR